MSRYIVKYVIWWHHRRPLKPQIGLHYFNFSNTRLQVWVMLTQILYSTVWIVLIWVLWLLDHSANPHFVWYHLSIFAPRRYSCHLALPWCGSWTRRTFSLGFVRHFHFVNMPHHGKFPPICPLVCYAGAVWVYHEPVLSQLFRKFPIVYECYLECSVHRLAKTDVHVFFSFFPCMTYFLYTERTKKNTYTSVLARQCTEHSR